MPAAVRYILWSVPSSFSSHHNSKQSFDYDVDRAVKEAMKGLKSVGDDARNIQQIYDEVSFNSLRRFYF